jgi:hypothetical protein
LIALYRIEEVHKQAPVTPGKSCCWVLRKGPERDLSGTFHVSNIQIPSPSSDIAHKEGGHARNGEINNLVSVIGSFSHGRKYHLQLKCIVTHSE